MKSKQTSVALILVLGSLAAELNAAVVSFSINQTFAQGAGQGDLTETQVMIGGAGSFYVDPGFSSSYFDFRFAGGGTFSTDGAITDGWGDVYNFLESFGLGGTVDSASVGTAVSSNGDWDSILVNGSTLGAWDNSHSGYLGFVSDLGQYGYIGYDYTRLQNVSTLVLKDGAFESIPQQGIVIGTPVSVVPEPGSLLGLGCLLGAGLQLRRRQKG